MILHCDLDLEDIKPIFVHDTLAHDGASPYQNFDTKGSAVEKTWSR